MLGQGFGIELEDGVKGAQDFVGKLGVGIESDDVREEGRSDRAAMGFETREEVVHEREVTRAAEFENESVEGRVRVVEVGLARGQVENFYGEEWVWLGSYELLDLSRGPNWDCRRRRRRRNYMFLHLFELFLFLFLPLIMVFLLWWWLLLLLLGC